MPGMDKQNRPFKIQNTQFKSCIMPVQDLTGMTFTRLTVIKHVGNGVWWCKCICGVEKSVRGGGLREGRARSCGCLKNELSASRCTKHGMFKTAEYSSWRCMINRCYNPKNIAYNRYGGRGITVCSEWLVSFEQFFLDMGKKPSAKHSIERINSNGNYEKNNCKWATQQEQCNNVCSNVFLHIRGEKLTGSQASRKYGINRSTLKFRMKNNWTDEDCVLKPIQKRKNKKECQQ